MAGYTRRYDIPATARVNPNPDLSAWLVKGGRAGLQPRRNHESSFFILSRAPHRLPSTLRGARDGEMLSKAFERRG